MIYFTEIFERAIPLFDDPDIREKYYSDKVDFQRIMRPLLIDGKNRFTSPTVIVDKLSEYSDAQGQQEFIEGTGADSYVLVTTPVENSVFTFRVENRIIGGSYDKTTNTVTFDEVIPVGKECSVAWYFAGAFTADFTNTLRSDFPISAIMEKIINILAHSILAVWSDQEMNRALENRNILTDNDFKLYSPASSVKARTEWHNQINKDMDTLIADLNWRILATPRGGSRFGK